MTSVAGHLKANPTPDALLTATPQRLFRADPLATVRSGAGTIDRVPIVVTIETADGSRQEIALQAEVRRRSALDDHLLGHKH